MQRNPAFHSNKAQRWTETAIAMITQHERLEARLVKLARDKSRRGRRASAENISDLFLTPPGAHSD